MIKYARQDVSQKDMSEVLKVLKSDFLTQGPYIEKFEHKVAEFCKCNYSIAVNSATSALHLAYLSLGLTKGDRLWTSPITFVSTSNAAIFCGANVDFVDIESDSFNMSIEALEIKLEKAKIKNQLPKIIVPVHFGGQSCDMKEISKLSKKYNFKIVEDASHAIGGKYDQNYIGNCRYSDICIFSFHPVKIITTGEGGMALTNKLSIANKIRSLRSHGINKNLKSNISIEKEIWNYKQLYLGYNYRITDIQAALGISQLGRIKKIIQKRNSIAKKYDIAFKDLPIISQKIKKNRISSYHLYLLKIDKKKTKKTRNQLYKFLEKNKIQPNFHYIPVYKHPYYQFKKYNLKTLIEAENYFNFTITIPMHTKLTQKEQNYIIKKIKFFFK